MGCVFILHCRSQFNPGVLRNEDCRCYLIVRSKGRGRAYPRVGPVTHFFSQSHPLTVCVEGRLSDVISVSHLPCLLGSQLDGSRLKRPTGAWAAHTCAHVCFPQCRSWAGFSILTLISSCLRIPVLGPSPSMASGILELVVLERAREKAEWMCSNVFVFRDQPELAHIQRPHATIIWLGTLCAVIVRQHCLTARAMFLPWVLPCL